MYKVEILPTAWEDLKNIEDWYRLNFDNDIAEKVSNNILDVIERLETFPDSGVLTPDPWLNKLGYKMVICKHHVAIFRLIDNTIFIYTVANTRREYTKLFKKDFEL